MGADSVAPAPSRPERNCPHCGGLRVQRWGTCRGSQRYRCRDCGRTFNALTGSAVARLRHAHLWLDYRAAMADRLGIRPAAHTLGIHPSTAARWRARLAPLIPPARIRPERDDSKPAPGVSPDENEIAQRLGALTAQQMRVLRLLSSGKFNKQIAYELAIAEPTVKVHVSAILKKLSVRNRTQAALLARSLR